jgi:hypothetical protein
VLGRKEADAVEGHLDAGLLQLRAETGLVGVGEVLVRRPTVVEPGECLVPEHRPVLESHDGLEH